MEQVWLGIDVAKDALDLALDGVEAVSRFDNNPSGHASLLEAVRAWDVQRVVLEATGGYERAIVAALLAGNIPGVVVVNPRQVRPRKQGHAWQGVR